jgi:hypothetical protein
METKKETKQDSIFESMMKIQKELKTIRKNKSGYSGRYADIENVWESIREIINNNNFVVFHSSCFDNGRFGVLTTALHSSGHLKTSFIPFIEWDVRSTDKKTEFRDAQDQGKELTYYKRYNLALIFNLVISDEDNDANKTRGNYKKSAVDGSLAAKKMLATKSKEEAADVYRNLSKEERLTDEVIGAVETMREKYKE